MTLEVPYIKGIPMPDELRYPDEQPEYPIITKKYFVEFLFLKDKSSVDDPDQDVMEKQSVYNESHMGDQSSVVGILNFDYCHFFDIVTVFLQISAQTLERTPPFF